MPPKPKQEWNRKDDLQCDKYGKNEEKQTGYTADDDNKVPAQNHILLIKGRFEEEAITITSMLSGFYCCH